MASRPRFLTERERNEVAAQIGPLVDRLKDRFGVSRSAILTAVKNAAANDQGSALPANYMPTHPLMRALLASVCIETDLSPASVVEDDFDAAVRARDALVYTARMGFDLTYETIGRALNGMSHDAVLDAYCRALGRIENDDKSFRNIVAQAERKGRRA